MKYSVVEITVTTEEVYVVVSPNRMMPELMELVNKYSYDVIISNTDELTATLAADALERAHVGAGARVTKMVEDL